VSGARIVHAVRNDRHLVHREDTDGEKVVPDGGWKAAKEEALEKRVFLVV
jgi:hypothetical protein